MNLLVYLIINTLAILIAGNIIPGIHIEDFKTAIIVAILIGIFNTLLKPVLVFLTLPITILTLGLFIFVINTIIILIVAAIVPGFKVDSFFWALLFGVITSLIASFLNSLVKEK